MDCDDIKKPVEVRLDFLYFIVLLQYLQFNRIIFFTERGLPNVRPRLLRSRVSTEIRLRQTTVRVHVARPQSSTKTSSHRPAFPKTRGLHAKALRLGGRHSSGQQLRYLRRILYQQAVRVQPGSQACQNLHGQTSIRLITTIDQTLISLQST